MASLRGLKIEQGVFASHEWLMLCWDTPRILFPRHLMGQPESVLRLEYDHTSKERLVNLLRIESRAHPWHAENKPPPAHCALHIGLKPQVLDQGWAEILNFFQKTEIVPIPVPDHLLVNGGSLVVVRIQFLLIPADDYSVQDVSKNV